MSPYDRMMLKVDLDEVTLDGCWIFRGALDQNGHGNVRFKNAKGEWSCTKAHRISYEHHHGPVPEGKVVRHTCDIRSCVCPDHLIPGTQRENVRDMVMRGRCKVPNITESITQNEDDCPF